MPLPSERIKKLRDIVGSCLENHNASTNEQRSQDIPHIEQLEYKTSYNPLSTLQLRRRVTNDSVERLRNVKRQLFTNMENYSNYNIENEPMEANYIDEQCTFIEEQKSLEQNCAPSVSTLPEYSGDNIICNEPLNIAVNRRDSSTSNLSNGSNGDFSPASDDDRTYLPSRKRRRRKCSVRSCDSSTSSSSSSSTSSSSSSDSSSTNSTVTSKALNKQGNNLMPVMELEVTASNAVTDTHLHNTPSNANNIISDIENNETSFNEPVPAVRAQKRARVQNKKKLAKILRNKGQSYVSASLKFVPERKIGPPCNEKCRIKCRELISEEIRQGLFDNYWKMGSLMRQRDYIAMHMTNIVPKYQYKKVDSNRKLKNAFYFHVDDKKQRVCKTFFKNTLGINDRPIRTVLDGKNQQGTTEIIEKRGKHSSTGIPTQMIDIVKEHIESIPRIESHYLRKQTTKQYIDGGKTLTDLFNDYKKDCISRNVPHVKIHTYRKIFKSDYNIGFFVPKKDQCDDCVAYKNADAAGKEAMKDLHENHLKEKQLSRNEKEQDKKDIGPTRIVSCYDLQAVMTVPKGDVSIFYYKSKLNCLNFTISELGKDHTECYFWTEVEGNRGVNEIASCVYKYLQKMSSSNPDAEFIFYSDNCCGQQKNNFMFFMYEHALKMLPIKSITHKFLIKGHTQNEGDAVHSTIEREVKKMLKSGPIYVPAQYIVAVRSAKKRGQPYIVNEMSHTEFYDIKAVTDKAISKNMDGEKVKLADIKIIKIIKNEKEAGKIQFFYKTSYADTDFKEIKLETTKVATRRQGTTATISDLKPLYTAKLPLAERKKKDLKALVDHNHIPKYYASSYFNHILS